MIEALYTKVIDWNLNNIYDYDARDTALSQIHAVLSHLWISQFCATVFPTVLMKVAWAMIEGDRRIKSQGYIGYIPSSLAPSTSL